MEATGTDGRQRSQWSERSQRSTTSGLLSLGLHGGLLVLVFTLVERRVVPEPHRVELTSIEVVDPPASPPPAPAPPPRAVRSPAGAKSGTLGRRGHDGAPRSQIHAPAVPDPFAELAVSYEVPSGPDPGNVAGTTGSTWGAGRFGDGIGAGYGSRGSGYGIGELPVPPAPPPQTSLARPPREKHAYHTWYAGARGVVGAIVVVELTIDPEGRVRNVRRLRGVDGYSDDIAIELAHQFEFYPALDPYGHPTWGLYRWEFVLSKEDRPSFPREWERR